jgi:hypothetical protein
MRRKRCWAVVLSTGAMAFTAADPASAGFFHFGKKSCAQPETTQCQTCDPCCKPKKPCCLLPPEAPDVEVGFAIPGVVRPGQAVRVSESSMRKAVQNAAVSDFKRESGTESGSEDKSSEERLDALEKDVREMKGLMKRLTVAVDRLAEPRPAKD